MCGRGGSRYGFTDGPPASFPHLLFLLGQGFTHGRSLMHARLSFSGRVRVPSMYASALCLFCLFVCFFLGMAPASLHVSPLLLPSLSPPPYVRAADASVHGCVRAPTRIACTHMPAFSFSLFLCARVRACVCLCAWVLPLCISNARRRHRRGCPSSGLALLTPPSPLFAPDPLYERVATACLSVHASVRVEARC